MLNLHAMYVSCPRMPPLQDTHVNNVVHIGRGDNAVAAQVEIFHFLPRVGYEIIRHALVQEESMCTHIFGIEIFYAYWGGDESCGTKRRKKKVISKHILK